MKKLLFSLMVMASSVTAQTVAEQDSIIAAATNMKHKLMADSTAIAINETVQLNSVLADNNIKIVSKSHQNGNFDSQWVAWDFSDSTFSADKSLQKRIAILLIKNTYFGQVNGDFVRVRKDRVNSESIAAIADIIE